MIDKIKKDCEKKKKFLDKTVYPPYLSGGQALNMAATVTAAAGTPSSQQQQLPNLSSLPLETNPYGIASLANTMPPPVQPKGIKLNSYLIFSSKTTL